MSVLVRNKERTQRHREECHVKSEAETGVMVPQAMECPGPPEAGTTKKRFSPRAFRENRALART